MAKREVTGLLFVVALILLMSLIPSMVISTQEDKEVGETQKLNQTISLQQGYYTTVTNISSNVNITIFYNDTSYSEVTKSISLGISKNYTVNNDNIEVTYTENLGNNTVFIQYKYSPYIGFPPETTTILLATPVFLSIILLLMIIAMIMGIFKKEEK